MSDTSLLMTILSELQELKDAFVQLPQWFSLSEVAQDKGLTRQTIRSQLLNGDFEPDVDFKYKGKKIYIARAVLPRIRRKRRVAQECSHAHLR